MKLWSNQTLNLSFSLPHTKKMFLRLSLHTYANINKTINQANSKGKFHLCLIKNHINTTIFCLIKLQENLMLFNYQ
jgi:hypothetical protein